MNTFAKIISGAAIAALLPLTAVANGYTGNGDVSAPVVTSTATHTIVSGLTYDRRGKIVPAQAGDTPMIVTKGTTVTTAFTYDRRGMIVPAKPGDTPMIVTKSTTASSNVTYDRRGDFVPVTSNGGQY